MRRAVVFFSLVMLFVSNIKGQESLNPDKFLVPENTSKVHAWWHWMNGNVTKDGITKDLESMSKNGIVQATILNVGLTSGEATSPRVIFDSPEWYEMFKFALKEANRLGITIGVHNCDGWSTSGGTWITPEKSMKTYVWTKTYLKGGAKVSVALEQPQARMNYYRDYAVIAFPAEDKNNKFQQSKPLIKVNGQDTKALLYDGNPKSTVRIRKGDKILINMQEDISVNKLSLFGYLTFAWSDLDKEKSRFSLSSSTDGVNYNKISDLDLVGMNINAEASFPETKARYFEMECLSNNMSLSEIGLLSNNDAPNFYSQVDRLLQTTVHVRFSSERDFNPIKSTEKGIEENSIIDVTEFMSSEGVLNWNAPAGNWCILRFGYTTTEITNAPATVEGLGLECDKFDSTAVSAHFEGFSRKLINASGDYLGNTFKFLFIDSWECQYQNWSDNFSEEFLARRGYDIKKWIPVLCGEIVENAGLSSGFLHDFRKTISDLIDENYYRYFKKLCSENKLELNAEVIYGEAGTYPPLDVLKSNKYMDMPMFEFWANPNENQLPVYSPAEKPFTSFPTFSALTNKTPIVGAEAYTGYANFSESPALLKPYGDIAYCAGINQLILHSYVHQPLDGKPNMTLGQFGGHYNRNNPWWEFTGDWLNYQARVQYLLQKGEPAVDVIYFIGDRLPQNIPWNMRDLPFGYGASVCNSEMLQKEASVVNGMLTFGGKQSFPLLVLPMRPTMEYATLKRLAELVNDGLVVLGSRPQEMLSLSDMKTSAEQFNKLADALWGKTPSEEVSYGKGKVLTGVPIAKILENMALVPDFSGNADNFDLQYIHKKTGDADVYFVFNQQNKPTSRELFFRVKDVIPEIWNPESGQVTKPVIYSQEANQIRIPVTFKPHEAFFFVFKKGSPANVINAVALNGEQIFPNKTGKEVEIPVGAFDKKHSFRTNNGGKYTFTTAEGKKIEQNLTPVNSAEITKYDATLEFFPVYDEKINSIKVTELKSLTEFDNLSIKYFAGKVKYTIVFDAPEKFATYKNFILNLGGMSATAEVYLNGKFLKYAWQSDEDIPFTGLLKKGNKLEITVATTSRNRIIGDLIQFDKVKNIISTTPWVQLKKEMPLTDSGLSGSLTLSISE